MKKFIFTLCFFCFFQSKSQTAQKQFDTTRMEYKGSKTEQLNMLMRKPLIAGHIEKNIPTIDPNFINLINLQLSINKDSLIKYLITNKVENTSIGGNINDPISYIDLNGKKIYAKYFVIHDVSSPEYKNDFPENINDSTWKKNNPSNHQSNIDCHLLITRTGKVRQYHNFSEGWRATKFESKILGVSSRGLFLHFELVQPRVYPPGKMGSAQKAPTPGFTDEQYKRLALSYVCASFRKGEWLIPAFHICIDEKVKYFDEKTTKWIEDNHDDPQNFENNKFTDEVLKLVSKFNIK